MLKVEICLLITNYNKSRKNALLHFGINYGLLRFVVGLQ